MSDPIKDQDDKSKIASLRNEIAQLKQENQLLREKLGIVEVNPGEKENSEPPSIQGIHNFSSPEEKIDLFQSLFRGHEEVYALRWENKKGLSGYSPSCENEWKPGVCGKPKIKCGGVKMEYHVYY